MLFAQFQLFQRLGPVAQNYSFVPSNLRCLLVFVYLAAQHIFLHYFLTLGLTDSDNLDPEEANPTSVNTCRTIMLVVLVKVTYIFA